MAYPTPGYGRHVTWLWAVLWLGTARAEVVDRVVAQVDQQLVLASDVTLETDLARRDLGQLPFWAPDHHDPLTRLIEAAVLRVASGEVGLYQPTTAEVDARLEAVRASFVDRASWTEFLRIHGIDEAALARVLRRRLVAERFLARNLQVSPDDEQQWLRDCDRLLQQLRARVRIREIPPMRTEP